MLECKTYTYAEFSALFNTRDNQGIKRRLDRWGIKYSTAGRGTGLKYTIEEISDPFVPFCILDLGFPPQTIFDSGAKRTRGPQRSDGAGSRSAPGAALMHPVLCPDRPVRQRSRVPIPQKRR